MLIVKRDTLFDVADAFGLGHEALRGRKLKDPFGSVVFCEDIQLGFTTRLCSKDTLRSEHSVVSVSDGYPTHLPFPEIRRFHSVNPKKTIGYAQSFQMYCATFAATGISTAYGMIPERIFLFTESPGFNLTKVIDRLRRYYADNRVPIFCNMKDHIDFDPLV